MCFRRNSSRRENRKSHSYRGHGHGDTIYIFYSARYIKGNLMVNSEWRLCSHNKILCHLPLEMTDKQRACTCKQPIGLSQQLLYPAYREDTCKDTYQLNLSNCSSYLTSHQSSQKSFQRLQRPQKVTKTKGKFCIRSDFFPLLKLSINEAIKSKQHHSLHIYRNLLQKFSTKFKLLWIPGIELADTQVRTATNQPLTTIENLNTQDILKYIKSEPCNITNITKTSTWH